MLQRTARMVRGKFAKFKPIFYGTGSIPVFSIHLGL